MNNPEWDKLFNRAMIRLELFEEDLNEKWMEAMNGKDILQGQEKPNMVGLVEGNGANGGAVNGSEPRPQNPVGGNYNPVQ